MEQSPPRLLAATAVTWTEKVETACTPMSVPARDDLVRDRGLHWNREYVLVIPFHCTHGFLLHKLMSGASHTPHSGLAHYCATVC